MSDKFKAILLNQSGEQFSREIKTLDKSFDVNFFAHHYIHERLP